jgi:Na+/H+-dicarboxylate symporter
LFLVNTAAPGDGVDSAGGARLLSATADENAAGHRRGIGSAPRPRRAGVNAAGRASCPTTSVKAAANNDMLAVMFFALMFGVGLAR